MARGKLDSWTSHAFQMRSIESKWSKSSHRAGDRSILTNYVGQVTPWLDMVESDRTFSLDWRDTRSGLRAEKLGFFLACLGTTLINPNVHTLRRFIVSD
jgi:hypothetical protein